MERVREAARLLKSRFQVRRVVLLGSLTRPAWFARDSDVDLAVEGLRGSDYWEAWRTVEDAIQDRPVDLIEIEHASQSLRGAIARHGIEL
jgi:predicted nucleotidyltransferase